MNVTSVRTKIFSEGGNVPQFIIAHIEKLKEGAILAVTSKIVALAEGRVADVKDKEKLIRGESSWRSHILKEWWLTVREGIVSVNAGIDDSNADGKLVLLPKDSFASAERVRAALMKQFHIRNCGVVITDSRVAPLRAGVTGVALGYAGFRGIRDYRGTEDLFGRTMQITQTNVADCLATTAVLVMGEGSEQSPLAIIEDASVEFIDSVDPTEVQIPMEQDMYRRLFEKEE